MSLPTWATMQSESRDALTEGLDITLVGMDHDEMEVFTKLDVNVNAF